MRALGKHSESTEWPWNFFSRRAMLLYSKGPSGSQCRAGLERENRGSDSGREAGPVHRGEGQSGAEAEEMGAVLRGVHVFESTALGTDFKERRGRGGMNDVQRFLA